MIKRLFNYGKAFSNKNSFTLPDVILHIGAPKSGTSAIQRFCMAHRQEILEKGYYYPEHQLDKNNVSGGHTNVAGPLIHGTKDVANANFLKFLAEAKEHNACLLLSAEAFYGQHQAMREMAEGLNVKILCFLRNPIEYLLANHNQGIKRHLSTERLTELIPRFLTRPAAHLTGQPLMGWAEAFGDDNCIFKPYQAPSSGGDLIEVQFLRALGWQETEVQALTHVLPGMTNRSYVKSALELKRLLNTVLGALPDHIAHEVDWFLQGYSDQALNQNGYTLADLSREIRAELEEKLLSQMQPVIERFPQLQEVAEITTVPDKKDSSEVLNLHVPLAELRASAPEVVDLICEQALLQRDQGRQDYAFCKLMDLLGIEFVEPKDPNKLSGLTIPQRTILENEKAQAADCLREMAVLLERQGLSEDAQFAINQALARRPKGPGIQAIKARIDRKLEMK